MNAHISFIFEKPEHRATACMTIEPRLSTCLGLGLLQCILQDRSGSRKERAQLEPERRRSIAASRHPCEEMRGLIELVLFVHSFTSKSS
jgi:hypothetical protein